MVLKKQKLAALVLLSAALVCACGKKEEYVEIVNVEDSFPLEAEPAGENPQQAVSDGPYAVLHTTAGDVTILLYPEQAPKAVENFIGLAKEGYYDGSSFHYAKRDELVQGGRTAEMNAYTLSDEAVQEGKLAPESAKERSIWGDAFEDEFDDGLHHYPGAVGMAGGAIGEDQNLSQFYLLVQDTKPENEQLVPANLYLNELLRMRMREFNESTEGQEKTDEEAKKFEDELNEEIQRIGTDGIPKEYEERYAACMKKYDEVGGAWGLDYKHTVFGQIVRGLNVAQAMTEVKIDPSNRRPKKELLIESIEILDELPE